LFNSIFPQRGDNAYRGFKLALWLLSLLVLMKLDMGLGCIFNGHEAARTADGIPLDTYTPAGTQAVVALFAVWGLGQVLIGLLGLLVLVRYRSLVPLMFVLILVEHLSRKLIFYYLPIAKVGTPPGFAINLALIAVEVVGLALALWRRRELPAPA